MSGGFYGGAFDNLAGTGGFYTGPPAQTEYNLGGGTGSWGGKGERRKIELRRQQQEELSRKLRKVLGIVTPEEAEIIRQVAEAEALRLQAEQQAAYEAALKALAANEDDETVLLAVAEADDELMGAVLAIATQLVAIKLKETIH